MEREVIILAASDKYSNSCVGGVDSKTGEWIRLVSSDKKICEALTPEMITFENGVKCSPFDKVSVSVIKKIPIGHQPENLLIDETKKFRKIERVSLDDILQVHPVENGRKDVSRFLENEHPYFNSREILEIKRSLYLIEVRNLKIYKKTYQNNRVRYKATFNYLGKDYINISMTDPKYKVEHDCEYKTAIIMLSLGTLPFDDGNFYKFVVKIFPLTEEGELIDKEELEDKNEILVCEDEFPF